MAKEFKAYDKLYAKDKGKLLYAWENKLTELEQWPEVDKFKGMPKPEHAVVAYAVYEAHGFENWQRFRVSLKGFSTGMKLARLWSYWTQFSLEYETLDIRVWNYLDAMKRGGLLDSELRVIK